VEKAIVELQRESRERFTALPEELKKAMLDNFQDDGAIPITQQQVSEMMANMQSVLMAAIQNQTGTSSSRKLL
jgi:hypothetical protein